MSQLFDFFNIHLIQSFHHQVSFAQIVWRTDAHAKHSSGQCGFHTGFGIFEHYTLSRINTQCLGTFEKNFGIGFGLTHLRFPPAGRR